LACIFVVAIGVHFAADELLQRLGFGGVDPQVAPLPATTADQSVERPERVASSLRVEAAEERDFPIEKEAVGSIDFNEDMTLQIFAPYQRRIIDLFA
jgi:hypothetical protein